MHKTLFLPALRAEMGDWTYYITSMSLSEVARRVGTASAVHQSEGLGDMIQRSLGARAGDIADYLLSQPQRLFGTIVAAVYGGEPKWLEIGIEEGARPWRGDRDRLVGAIGILCLSGTEELFALDGQHRVVGTQRALEVDPSLGEEEVAVIFVGHSKDQAGLERTRRLFSTLNRYAKPVSKRDIIALDEDDAVAIVTRRLFDTHRLFVDRVSLGERKPIPVHDRANVTSIVALYESVEMVLKTNALWNPKHKRFRPDDGTLEGLTEYCAEYWDAVVDENLVLQSYLGVDTSASAMAAAPYRGTHGGHLFFRPVGILAHSWVATMLCKKEKLELRVAIRRLAAVPMELSQGPWVGLLWDAENRRMRTAPEVQRVAKWIMYYIAGGALEQIGSTEAKLRVELAGLLNMDPDEVELPSVGG